MNFMPADQVIIRKGAEVAFSTEESGIDISVFGRITDTSPADPESMLFDGAVEVTWGDGETEILDRSDLVLVIR
jgi:hypothetical protein